MPQVPHRPHAQLSPFEKKLRLSAGADGAALFAAVEGSEGRDPLQCVGDGRPPVGPQLVHPVEWRRCGWARGRGERGGRNERTEVERKERE